MFLVVWLQEVVDVKKHVSYCAYLLHLLFVVVMEGVVVPHHALMQTDGSLIVLYLLEDVLVEEINDVRYSSVSEEVIQSNRCILYNKMDR